MAGIYAKLDSPVQRPSRWWVDVEADPLLDVEAVIVDEFVIDVQLCFGDVQFLNNIGFREFALHFC